MGTIAQEAPSSALAEPVLGAAQKRNPDVAAHVQFIAAILERQPRAIDFAVVGIENLAARPLSAVQMKSPQNLEPDERLVLLCAAAQVTRGMRTLWIPTGEVSDAVDVSAKAG